MITIILIITFLLKTKLRWPLQRRRLLLCRIASALRQITTLYLLLNIKSWESVHRTKDISIPNFSFIDEYYWINNWVTKKKQMRTNDHLLGWLKHQQQQKQREWIVTWFLKHRTTTATTTVMCFRFSFVKRLSQRKYVLFCFCFVKRKHKGMSLGIGQFQLLILWTATSKRIQSWYDNGRRHRQCFPIAFMDVKSPKSINSTNSMKVNI